MENKLFVKDEKQLKLEKAYEELAKYLKIKNLKQENYNLLTEQTK